MQAYDKADMKNNIKYPYISMWVGMILSLAYLLLLLFIGISNPSDIEIALPALFLAAFYWYAIYAAKKAFEQGKISAGGVRLVNLGGMLLFLFGSFAGCLSGIQMG